MHISRNRVYKEVFTMKERKGFTLIELIVVIAIIGVLAAILVPSMLGYVRKSKISSANDAAASVQRAVNTACMELDEVGEVIGDGIYTHASGAAVSATAISPGEITSSDVFGKKVFQYLDAGKKVAFYAKIQECVCVAVAATEDGTYTGTYPTGVVTVDNYKTTYKASDLQTALDAAAAKISK